VKLTAKETAVFSGYYKKDPRIKMRIYHKLLFIHFILPISIGTLIYLAFRPVHLTVFHWAETLGFYSLILKARTLFDIGYLIPEWVIYSLPNGLWSYSFMFFISFIWGGEDVLEKIYFVVLVVALSVGSELGQLLNFIPGIFCLTDVALYSFGLLAGYCSGQYYSKGEYV
jgi:hypothetical protein